MAISVKTKPYLLFDGAMGTYYASRLKDGVLKCELANLRSPEAVEDIHREYLAAGAGAIKTNTFAANTAYLNVPFSQVAETVRAGYAAACRAAGDTGAYVFADIGPMPEGSEGRQLAEYKDILDVFLDCGAEAFLFETFSEYNIVAACAEYVKQKRPGGFVLAQFAVTPDGYTRKGLSAGQVFRAMEQCGAVDAYGLNCICGPHHMQEILAKLPFSGKPVSAMPNAGYPAVVGERTVYNANASYFAQAMADIRALGVPILGGCCGTTPEHIALVKNMLEHKSALPAAQTAPVRAEKPAKRARNAFKDRLESGYKAIAVELDPPFNTDTAHIIKGARALKEAGADIITVPDNPLARARADSAMIAAKIKRECGIETLPHIACRDRNLNALKAVMLGLHIESVRSVLAVTGDPIPEADRNDVKSVYNFNAKNLSAFIEDLNHTAFAGDPFYIGAALNVNANRPELELKRAEEKILAGVQFFLTQPVFSQKSAEVFREAKAKLKAKILAGILPVVSYRNACFINAEVPGMDIGDETVALFRDKTAREAEAQGIRLAVETARGLSPYADGYYLITPLNRIQVMAEIIKSIRSF